MRKAPIPQRKDERRLIVTVVKTEKSLGMAHE